MIRDSVFSPPDVILFKNEEYFPVERKITANGFPRIASLESIYSIYSHQYFCRFGFSVNVVIGYGINFPLAILAGNEQSSLNKAIEYDPQQFLLRLRIAKQRYIDSFTMNEHQLEILSDVAFSD
eukprot:TRINITY_DN3603_c0_g1_i1.p1 TRINITY_DN3603_c0_g1~~TRINITY_DN3603_c0_g1_i1.p1  ORF type:complete len:124 (+),score=20.51 TRINITY_DN3603_c0_g1_i1:67-438(+)